MTIRIGNVLTFQSGATGQGRDCHYDANHEGALVRVVDVEEGTHGGLLYQVAVVGLSCCQGFWVRDDELIQEATTNAATRTKVRNHRVQN